MTTLLAALKDQEELARIDLKVTLETLSRDSKHRNPLLAVRFKSEIEALQDLIRHVKRKGEEAAREYASSLLAATSKREEYLWVRLQEMYRTGDRETLVIEGVLASLQGSQKAFNFLLSR